MKIEAITSYETPGLLRNMRNYNPEDRALHNHRCQNLSTNIRNSFIYLIFSIYLLLAFSFGPSILLSSLLPNTIRLELKANFVSVLLFIIIISSSRVGLSPLGTAATSGLLYKPQMIDESDCGAIGGMKIGRGNRSTRRKPAPAPLCPPQIPSYR
jgi:hypothetical protein